MRNRLNKGMRLFMLFCCFCAAVLMQPLYAFAEGQTVDTERQAQLMIQYPCGSAEFKLYRAADMLENGIGQKTDDFADCPMEWSAVETEEWKELAQTAALYAETNQIQETAAGKISEDGKLVLTNLQTGLYLVVGSQSEDEEYCYTPMPFFVTLPSKSASGDWTYDVSVYPKYEQTDKEDETESTESMESAESTESTEVPETSDESVHPGNSGGSGSSGGSSNLPHTGQLRWPIPFLVLGGLMLFVIGWIRSRRGDESGGRIDA